MADIVDLLGSGRNDIIPIVLGHQSVNNRNTLCPGLFGKLPAELRVMIYKEVFAGSEMNLLSIPRGPPLVLPRGGRHLVFYSSGHHCLLLTCRALYEEARAMYWSSTAIVNGNAHQRFSVRYLLRHIPEFSKRHIQHLHGLPLGGRGRYTCPYGPSLVADQARLRQFPNLKSYRTCEMQLYAANFNNPRVFDVGPIQAILTEVFWACPPLFTRSTVPPFALWRIRLPGGGLYRPHPYERIVFGNAQSGKLYVTHNIQITDADGFDHVM